MVITPNAVSTSRNYRPALAKGLSTASSGDPSRGNTSKWIKSLSWPGKTLRNFRRSILGKNFWKNYFKVYDTLNESPSYQILLKRVLQEARIEPGQSILDAGCGTGNIIPLLQIKGIAYTGIDIIPEAMDIARRKKSTLANIDIRYGNISQNLEFESNSFDRIISNNVVYILSDKGRELALKEFFRVLKPGGRLVISTLKTGFNPRKIYVETFRMGKKQLGTMKALLKVLRFAIPSLKILFYNRIINNKQQKGAYKYFSRQEIKDLLASAGFKEIVSRSVYAGEGILVTCVVNK